MTSGKRVIVVLVGGEARFFHTLSKVAKSIGTVKQGKVELGVVNGSHTEGYCRDRHRPDLCCLLWSGFSFSIIKSNKMKL
jgi:hypothetical protein